MHHFLRCLLLLALLAPATLAQNGNFLIIVDTSSAMKKRAQAVERTVFDFLATGCYGQMRAGDHYGIWTFSDKVQMTNVPIQKWTPAAAHVLAAQAAQHIQKQSYRHEARLDVLVPEMLRTVAQARQMNVFLISDGGQFIYGTPFDRRLNLFYGAHFEQFRKEGWPFVTTFVARVGEIQAWSVNAGGDRIAIPSLDDPPPKPAMTNSAPSALSPLPVKTADSNELSKVVPAKPAEAKLIPDHETPKIIPSASKPASVSVPPPVENQIPVAPVARTSTTDSPAPVVSNGGPVISPKPILIASKPATVLSPASPVTIPPATNAPIAAESKKETPAPVLEKPAATNSPATSAPAMEKKAHEPPKTIEPVRPIAEPAAAPASAVAVTSKPEIQTTVPVKPKPLAIEQAALPPQPTSRGGLLFTAAVLLLAAGGLLWLLLRRLDRAPRPSLISQSMKRGGK